jgi:predicted dinucleotide-utilizing enzyme
MTKSDLERLATSLSQMTQDNQIDRIVKIIQHGNPEMNVVDGAVVDLDLLAPQTLKDLKEFVAGQFEAMGKFG